MSKGNFDRCFELLLKDEGGYVNDPVDPGGETNMGISKRSYPNEDIKNLTKNRVRMIYKRDYWSPIKADDLPSGLDYVVFDAAVNSGVKRSSQWLQRALGVPQDGKIGPVTLEAVRKANVVSLIDTLCDVRLSFLQNLSTWYRFKNGWTRRVEGVRSEAKRMFETSSVPVSKKRSVFPFLVFVVFVTIVSYFIFGG